jgi:hypothetical protein
MALQIRRGTEAERQLIIPLQGELIYTTDTKKVYIGDGVTLGGVLIAGGGSGGAVDSVNGQTGNVVLSTSEILEGTSQYFTEERAQDAAALMFTNGNHTGISFVYDDANNRIDAVVSGGAGGGSVESVNGLIGTVVLTTTNITEGTSQYFTEERAQDAAALMFTNGNHTGISFVYDNIDNVFNVSLEDQISIDRLIANDTIFTNNIGLVDEENFLNIAGDVNIVGTLFTSSSISAPVITTTNLGVDSLTSLLRTDYPIFLNQSETDPSAILVTQSSNINTFPPSINLRRARGTEETEFTVEQGDRIGSINFRPFDGISTTLGTSIFSEVAGPVSSGVVPTALVFQTTRVNGTFLEAARFDQNGTLIIGRNGTTPPVSIFSVAHNSNTSTNDCVFYRARGTTASQQPVIENDPILDLTFRGRSNTIQSTCTVLRSVVDGTVGDNIIPGRFEVLLANSSGVVTRRLALKNDGRLQVDSIEPLNGKLDINASTVTLTDFLSLPIYEDDTARDTAITLPSAGMVIYISGSVNRPQFYNGTSWINL